MSELIEKLGIDAGLLIAQIVNFALVALILWKFTYKPVVNMLEQRRLRIEKSIAEAEHIEKERESMNQEFAAKLEEAKKEASKIIDQAKKTGDELLVSMRKDAEKEYERMVGAAEKQIAAASDEAKKSLQTETTRLVVEALTKVSKEVIDLKVNEALVEKSVKELQ